jgi:hypothetical protein
VAQKTPDGSITAEIWAARGGRVEYSTFGGLTYSKLGLNGSKIIFSPGITGQGRGTSKDSAQIMEKMNGLLAHEGLKPKHIVRQWNYIPRIINPCLKEDHRQNYQLFNNARAVFYNQHHFTSGFPASTGIGMKCGPLTVGFIALSGADAMPLSNPQQIDAHRYSGKVLVPTGDEKPDESPRFERAKAFRLNEQLHVLVSGTASIKGEDTIGLDDAAEQSRYTVSNIEKLIARENLLKHGLEVNGALRKDTYLRVYYKDLVYYPIIKAQVERTKLNTNVVYLEASVCRPDLLVEMECALIYENS